jgi:hypothetical protein
MKGIKFKPFQSGRKALLLGATVAIAGLSLIGGAGVAHAALGTDHGKVTLNPATGPLTTSPTWSTTEGCPVGNQGSEKLLMVNVDGTTTTAWSANINGAANPVTNQAVLQGDQVADFEGFGGFNAGQTTELVVQCTSGASGTGSVMFVMDEFLTFNADGTTFSTSATPPAGPVTPTVAVTASPSTAQVGTSVLLTATVSANSAPVTSGTVQFSANGAAVGTPASVNASGVATTTTSFTTAGAQSITAAYTTGDAAHFNNATSTTPFALTITTSNPLAVNEIITVTVPPQGTFTFGTADGASNPTVPLTVAGTTSLTGTGSIDPVQVKDSRTGLAANAAVPSLVNGFSGFPGWSVVGQATDFSNPSSHPAGTISAAQLSWTPAPAQGDYVPGGAATGLGTAQVLGSAATGHGQGTSTLGAGLSLAIPATAPAGAYTSTLTLTANPTANFS